MVEPQSPQHDTRRAILDAAWTLLEEQGAAVTLAAVAERAGVSRQALYLHFASRSGLLVSLVEHIDTVLGLAQRTASVREAASATEALEAMVALHATYHEHIIAVARVLDGTRHTDPALAAAWENRMAGRREGHEAIIRRLADEGRLAPGWDVASAAQLFYSLTLPRVWEELVLELGWTTEQYRVHMTRLLTRALVV